MSDEGVCRTAPATPGLLNMTNCKFEPWRWIQYEENIKKDRQTYQKVWLILVYPGNFWLILDDLGISWLNLIDLG